MAESDDLVAEGREAFELCADAESHNRATGLSDIRFAREGIQWPDDIRKQREQDGRPCLTINKLPAFLRQVVNDARQNKPSISVHPVDDHADKETADIIGDLIRNIEYTSDADVAYDTGVECATGNGFGYWRVTADYSYDDAFEQDLRIKRIRNPFSVYGDPNSQTADSSDWDVAFVTDAMKKSQFKRQWKDKSEVDWDDTSAWGGTTWRPDDDTVVVAEWWTREDVDRPIALVGAPDGVGGATYVVDKKDLTEDPELAALIETGMMVVKQERIAKSCKVTQRFMSGAEILETREWPGRFIPIVPVYGDEFDIEGKVFRRSLIHDAVGPQQMFNFWRTAATELVALAPRVPYIGPKGSMKAPAWQTANRVSHPFLEYEGATPPQRQPLDSGTAAGALQEALNAADDMKSVTGLYDASLGARSNEISGRAIMARQREGDVSTFHFSDNMARAIRHTGRILIDLIPHYYNAARVLRVRGEDGTERAVAVNQQAPKLDDKGQPVKDDAGNAVMALHDLTAGKYDLTVTTGPSFTTRRQEAAAEMTELIRAFPQIAPVIADLLAQNLDWPGSEEMAERLKRMVPPEALGENGGLPPQIQKFIEEGKAMIEALTQKVAKLEADRSVDMAKVEVDRAKVGVEQEKVGIARFEAQTDRIQALKPEPQRVEQPVQA